MPSSVQSLDPWLLFSILLPLHQPEVKMLLHAGPSSGLKVALGAFLALFFIWLSSTLYYRKRSSYPLPPGPPGKFLVGNLGSISEHPELDYIRWGKEYSKSSMGSPLWQHGRACQNKGLRLVQVPMLSMSTFWDST